MLGAIIGDIIGSTYEVEEVEYRKSELKKKSYEDRIKVLDKDYPLLRNGSIPTDDTCLTVALMDALMHDKNYEYYLKKYGVEELNRGLDSFGRNRFGKGFVEWLKNEKEGNSFGNGSSMRVSPIGFYFNDLDTVISESSLSSIPSHSHKDAVIGANAVASAIFLSRIGCTKNRIKRYLEETFGYDLNLNLEYLQRNYMFYSSAKNSVPQAIYCFLESDSFEDCLRKSLSIGGDSDTICAISCSIAEAYYGIDERLLDMVLPLIPKYYLEVINEFYKRINKENVLKLEKRS